MLQTYFRRLCQLTEQARRTYQNIVAALEREAKQDKALQGEAPNKTDEEELSANTVQSYGVQQLK